MNKYQITVKYNEIIKTFNINDYDTIGSIFEFLMNKFNLYIYSLETIHCIICDSDNNEIKKIDFKMEYDNFNITFSDCITQENIDKNITFVLFDRNRDENGNVIKNNNFIDKYNNFVAIINDQSMARNLQNRYDRYIKYNNLINNLSNSRTSLSNNLLNMFMPPQNQQNNMGSNILNFFNTSEQQQTEQTIEQTTEQEEVEQTTEQNEGQQTTEQEEIEQTTEQEEVEQTTEQEQTNQSNNTNYLNELLNIINNRSRSTRRVRVNPTTDISGNPQLRYEFTINSIPLNQNNIPDYGRNLFQYSTSDTSQNNPTQFTFQNSNSSGTSTIPMSNSYNQSVNNLFNAYLSYFSSQFSNLNIPRQDMADIKMVLTKEELDKLEVMTYKQYKDSLENGIKVDDNSKCPISLQKFEDEDKIIKLKCGHIFHSKYIKEWLSESSNKCPVCRKEVAKGIPNETVNEE